jgi:hypothetical protein
MNAAQENTEYREPDPIGGHEESAEGQQSDEASRDDKGKPKGDPRGGGVDKSKDVPLGDNKSVGGGEDKSKDVPRGGGVDKSKGI